MIRDEDQVPNTRLQSAFADLLGTPPPVSDPLPGVHRRVGRLQRRRSVVATVTALVVLAGAGGAIYGVTRPSGTAHHEQAATVVTAIDPRLALHVDAAASVGVGAEELVTVVLTGTGESADVYGWRVAWGDGGLDRVFGSANCRTGTPAAVDATRVFAHHYLQTGPERIIVELTRCGTVEARTITQITVTPDH